MRTGFGVYQLPGNADPVACSAHRAFEDIADAKLAPALPHIGRLTLVGEARIAGDTEQPADAGERGDDLLDHAVDEIFLFRIARQVLEWQDGDRWLVWQDKCRAAFDRHCCCPS